MEAELRFGKLFKKAYKHLKNAEERDKLGAALEEFQERGSSAPHFKYLTEIDKKLKAKGLVLGRLTPLVAAKASGAWRILLREDAKDQRYTVLDIQPHENCYRDWRRKQKSFL